MKKMSLSKSIFYFGILLLNIKALSEETITPPQKRQDFAIVYEVVQFHNIKTIQFTIFN